MLVLSKLYLSIFFPGKRGGGKLKNYIYSVTLSDISGSSLRLLGLSAGYLELP
jgi:hypothetical protein